MSAAYGHMNHLYDNPRLTFAQIKDIFKKAAGGKLVGTEKTDGQNLFVSYSIKEKRAKAARNKGNMKSGGLTAAELAEKFAGRKGLYETFTDAFAAFDRTAELFSVEDQLKLFGPDANIFYNAEIQDPRTPNVINYDLKTLTIHRVGHVEIDKSNGELIPRDLTGNVELLQKTFEELQKSEAGDQYRVQVNAVRDLKGLSNANTLHSILRRLEKEINAVGVSDNQTIAQYLINRLSTIIDEKTELDDLIKKQVVQRILKTPGVTVITILKSIPKENVELAAIVRDLIKQENVLLKQAISPIEDIVHDFSVAILQNLESTFILDQKKEVKRLQKETAMAIEAIKNSGSEEAMNILQLQLRKLKKVENISTAAEGFVFDYDGMTYKFTGNFAPANQLLGLFKYGRGKIPPLVKEEQKDLNSAVALYPGKFKPPHAGHFLAAKAALENAGKVYVYVSPKEHDGITIDQSLNIWNLYIDSAGLTDRIYPVVAEKSPVTTTYDYIDSAAAGETIYLVLGEKDINDSRFNRAIGRREDLQIHKQLIPPQAAGISATQIRSSIIEGDKINFFKNIPDHLSDKQKEMVWNVLTENKLTSESKKNFNSTPSSLAEDLEHENKQAKDQIFYWTAHSDRDVPIGFKIPHSNIIPHHAEIEKTFEKVRKKDFPDRPSRLNAIFLCPNLSGFCRPNASLHGGDIFKVKANGKYFIANGEFFTEAVFHPTDTVDYAIAYWTSPGWWYDSEDTEYSYNEVVLQGEAEVVEKVSEEEIKEISAMATGNVTGLAMKKKKKNQSTLIREKELNINEEDYMIDRSAFLNEQLLRKHIRKALRKEQKKQLFEMQQQELMLRKYIRTILKEAAEDHPHQSTGINVLEELLKKIIPVIEADYKSLTTDNNQRASFRAHTIRAAQNILAPERAEFELEVGSESELEEQDLDVNVGNDPKFIDVRPKKKKEEETPEEKFGIPGEDETGRNVAMRTFDKISKSIVDSYSVLQNNQDRTLFYDYLITNLKLYFDKFEDELQTTVAEPTTPEYSQEKNKSASELAV
jgi:hypothetical protein